MGQHARLGRGIGVNPVRLKPFQRVRVVADTLQKKGTSAQRVFLATSA